MSVVNTDEAKKKYLYGIQSFGKLNISLADLMSLVTNTEFLVEIPIKNF